MWCHVETSTTLHGTTSQKTNNLQSPQYKNINPAYSYESSEHLSNLQLEYVILKALYFYLMSFDCRTKMIFYWNKNRIILVCINKKQVHWNRKQNL